ELAPRGPTLPTGATTTTATLRTLRLAGSGRTPSASTTCTATYGSGVSTVRRSSASTPLAQATATATARPPTGGNPEAPLSVRGQEQPAAPAGMMTRLSPRLRPPVCGRRDNCNGRRSEGPWRVLDFVVETSPRARVASATAATQEPARGPQ